MLKKTYKERQCNCCYGKNDVIEVFFRSDFTNQGNVVALCKDCRKKLCKIIKDKDGEQDAAD